MPFVHVDGGFFEIHDEARVNLGECQMDRHTNNWYVYVKAGADLEQGNVLRPHGGIAALAAAQIDHEKAIVGSTELELLSTATSDFFEISSAAIKDVVDERTPRYHENLMVTVSAGTGIGQTGVVIKETAAKLTVHWFTNDDGTLKTALAADSAFMFNAPWRAILASTNSPVLGFAQQDIEEGQYFWALCKGLGVGRSAVAIGTGATPGTPLQTSPSANAGLLSVSGADTLRAPIATAEAIIAGTTERVFPITANADYPISVLVARQQWE